MPRSPAPHHIVAVTVAALLSVPGHAQLVTFKNFRHYPAGQWQQELVGYRSGKALGPPITSTTCSSPFDPKTLPALAQAAKESTPACTTKILTDQEQLGEFETVCKMGSRIQTLHSRMRTIDDRTISMEMRSTIPGIDETLMKSKVTYLGPCTTAEAVAAEKPKPEDCAAIAKMRSDAEGGIQCRALPPNSRAQCEAQMASGIKMIATLEQQCK